MIKDKRKRKKSVKEEKRVNFSCSLYELDAIERAIKDYNGLADFILRKKKESVEVKIKKIRVKEMEPIFVEEFSNYVLSLNGVMQ